MYIWGHCPSHCFWQCSWEVVYRTIINYHYYPTVFQGHYSRPYNLTGNNCKVQHKHLRSQWNCWIFSLQEFVVLWCCRASSTRISMSLLIHEAKHVISKSDFLIRARQMGEPLDSTLSPPPLLACPLCFLLHLSSVWCRRDGYSSSDPLLPSSPTYLLFAPTPTHTPLIMH